jgi:hypothetical protein
MNIYLITISTLCYLFTAVGNFYQKDYPHGFIWMFYGLANCGFIWHELIKLK